MAVYYKWIKGCQQGATLDEGQWSYITWGKTKSTETDVMPQLAISSGRDGVKTNFGYFLTSDMPTPEIKNNWNFKSGIKCNTILPYAGENNIEIGAGAKAIDILAPINMTNDVVSSGQIFTVSAETISLKHQSQEYRFILTSWDKGFQFNGSINTQGDVTISGNFSAKDYIHSDSYCEAEYFNATSDIRAKENIRPATYNALELIKKLQIYTYNYINKPESVTGIIAQELLEVQPKELDLVSNINASGENGDYMSIKNDKLMFVLMKAIQEQQEKIEALEYELQCLKNN